MPELNYKDYKDFKNKFKNYQKSYQTFLIYGQEAIYKPILSDILNLLIPDLALNKDKANKINKESSIETIDNDDIYAAIEKLNTFSLLSNSKVVILANSQIFYSKENQLELIDKAKEAFDKDDIKKSARYILSFLALSNNSFEDAYNSEFRQKLFNNSNDFAWFDSVLDYCKSKNMQIEAKDYSQDLQIAINKGFSDDNYLIITADSIDKRKSLYKALNDKAIIIDCSIPMGSRKADKDVQDLFVKEKTNEFLAKYNKTMAQDAYLAFYDMTGFDLGTILNNLEKLVSFVGDRKKIESSDVKSVLKRTKQDPIYELVNAILDKNLENSLFYLDSILSGDVYPLQILAAITNQVRKLLIIKDFTESFFGKAWKSGLDYNKFQKNIVEQIYKFDQNILNILENWEKILLGNSGDLDKNNLEANSKKITKQKKSAKITTDIFILKDSKNFYPVYQTFLKSDKFTKSELLNIFNVLHETDLKIKSFGKNSKLLLEKLIFEIVL